MDLLAEYVYKVYQEKSFSAAARSLYVSQPALSGAVARLEKELGFRLFDRSTVPLSLTPEGRVYIDMLEEIMESERLMHRRLRQLSDATHGTLLLGGNSYTSYYFIPTVCGVFHRHFPDVKIHVDMGNIGSAFNLTDKLQKQLIDVFFSYRFDSRTQTAIPLFDERVVIAMHRHMKGADKLAPFAVPCDVLLSSDIPKSYEIIDFSLFDDVPFLDFGKTTSTYGKMMDVLGEYKISDCYIENARHSGVHYNMMCAGLGALMTTTSAVAVSSFPTDDLLFFVPPANIGTRTFYAILKKNAEISPVVSQFLEIAKQVSKMEKKAFSLYV